MILINNSSQKYEERRVEIELQDNNLYNNEENNDIYRHSKLSNNPNEFNEDIKPDSAFEDRGIIDKDDSNKKKLKNNWDISTNMEKQNSLEKENNIDNDNDSNNKSIKMEDNNEEKIDDDNPIQSKISGINNEDNKNINNTNNINNENDIEYEDNDKKNDDDDEEENEGNNNLILDDDENLTSKDEKGKNKGMSEKDY